MPREELQIEFSRRTEESYHPHLVPCGNQVSIDQTTDGITNAVSLHEKTVICITGTAALNGDNTLVAANASYKYRLVRVTLQGETTIATTMQLKLGTTTVERVLAQNQGDGVSVVYAPNARPCGAGNEAIVLNLSGANSCGYTIHYIREAA